MYNLKSNRWWIVSLGLIKLEIYQIYLTQLLYFKFLLLKLFKFDNYEKMLVCDYC